jgi:hypothetical protein
MHVIVVTAIYIFTNIFFFFSPTSVHSGPLSSGVLQSVLDMLWFQIQKHLDNPGYHSNAMAIFLVFTRRVLSAGKLKTLAATKKWTDMLISIIKESKQGMLYFCCCMNC